MCTHIFYLDKNKHYTMCVINANGCGQWVREQSFQKAFGAYITIDFTSLLLDSAYIGMARWLVSMGANGYERDATRLIRRHTDYKIGDFLLVSRFWFLLLFFRWKLSIEKIRELSLILFVYISSSHLLDFVKLK